MGIRCYNLHRIRYSDDNFDLSIGILEYLNIGVMKSIYEA